MINNAEQLWFCCLDYIKNNVSASQYDAWFASLTFDGYIQQTHTLRLKVPNSYVRDYLEENYLKLLRQVLIHFFGRGIHLVYNEMETKEQVLDSSLEEKKTPFETYLDSSRTFDNFISGISNRLPRAVAMSIVESPSHTKFNPFFVFGPSGCGKTHLINAIGLKMLESYPSKRILYVSARLFQVQYTEAVLGNALNDFIRFYQTIDVLIIDDVQEWLTAIKTQEIFFHIFDHLFRNGKRIILASDRPPIDLKGMIDRLLTRLKCGLVAEIEKPDTQLCKDILCYRIEQEGLHISDDVINYIANVASGSIRDLYGIVNSIKAASLIGAEDIDLPVVRHIMKSFVRNEPKVIDIDAIVDNVCSTFGIDKAEIAGKSRRQEIVQARQLSMYLADKLTKMSKSQIGRKIAGRDHTTVIHSCSKISALLKQDSIFANKVKQIETSL